MDGTILIADDDRTIRTVLTQALTRAGCRVHATSSLATLLRWVDEGRADLVITDVMMPDGNGIETLPKIHALQPDLPVIVISAQNTIMTAIQANEAAAWEYLPKPFDLPDLLAKARRAIEISASAKGKSAPKAPPTREEPDNSVTLPLVGQSAVMQNLYRLVARMMNVAMPVLIIGESGTGKTIVARALHQYSQRKDQPLILSNASDFSSDQAIADLLHRAEQGVILVDPLGDLDLDAQSKLVRLLDQDPQTGPKYVAVSDEKMMDALEQGHLRQDLYYRLSGLTLSLPPLRERVEDIPLLAEHFMKLAAHEPATRLSDDAMSKLRAYSWPGNVRQLENTIKRLTILAQGQEITAEDVAAALGEETGPTVPRTAITSEFSLSEAVEHHVRRYFELHGDALPPPGVYQRILHEIEAPLIEVALDFTGGNQARCADILGINRNTLRKKTLSLDISVTRRRKLM